MYAYVSNNTVVETFEQLPQSLRNVSNVAGLSSSQRSAVGLYTVVDARPPLPSRWHSYANDRLEYAAGAVTRHADVVRMADADIRAQLKDEINALREQKLAAGFTYGAYMFDSDVRSLANITATVAAVSAGVPLPSNFTWRSSDNNDVPMTAQQVVMLGATALAFGNAIYQKSWAHKAAIDSSTDPANYDITQGW